MNTVEYEPAQVTRPVVVTAAASSAKHSSHWWVWPIVAVVLAAVATGAYFLVKFNRAAQETKNKQQHAPHDLPVVTSVARKGDLHIYLTGLGSVAPITVTLKSRVDGAIMEVHFTEGQLVKEGDPLVDIDPRPYMTALHQAQGQLVKDTAVQTGAEWNVNQDKVAIEDRAIAQQTLHNDTATYEQAKGAVEVDQAAIDTAQLNVTYAHITSPITGRIGLRLVDPGNIVHAADTTGLAVITQLQPIDVVFTLPEDDLLRLQKRVNTGKPIEVEAYDRELRVKLATGKLLAVDNQIDPTTGTVKIKAEFANTDNSLFPQQFVNARMEVDNVPDAILVPSAAIQHSPTSAFVYVVKPDNTVTMRNVTIGATQTSIGSGDQDLTAIDTGVESGDIVVVDGVDKLTEGTKVLPRASGRPAGTQPTTGPTTAPAGRGNHARHH